MMGLADDMPVTLVIKAPNQKMEDQTVECQSTWTIKKLKKHLESVYPSKPKHNEQRLIYSGRLLQDHLTLKEILRNYDETEVTNSHTVHLVCSGLSEQKPSKSKPSNTETSNPSGTQSEASSVLSSDGVRHRFSPSSNPTASSVPTSGPDMYSAYQPVAGQPYPGAMYGYEYTPEQYAAMMQQQQLYSQYMMQYMQYYQSAVYPYQSFNPQAAAYFPQSFIPTSTMPHGPMGPQVPPQQAQPQQAQPAEANAPRAPPARQNVRMNAQGGMEEDDEDDGEPRDWLHHTYFFMRFLTFMGILFFYSNVTRFLVVFSGSFAIYFLQKLRKYMQRRERDQQRQREAEERANNQENAQNQQDDSQQQEPQQNENQDPQAQNNTPPAEDNSQQQPEQHPEAAGEQQQQQTDNQANEVPQEGRLSRIFLFACNTVQAFFTSLVPAPPELLDAN